MCTHHMYDCPTRNRRLYEEEENPTFGYFGNVQFLPWGICWDLLLYPTYQYVYHLDNASPIICYTSLFACELDN